MNTTMIMVAIVMGALEVLSGMMLIATEQNAHKYPAIVRISKAVFYGIGLIALVAILVMEW